MDDHLKKNYVSNLIYRFYRMSIINNIDLYLTGHEKY